METLPKEVGNLVVMVNTAVVGGVLVAAWGLAGPRQALGGRALAASAHR